MGIPVASLTKKFVSTLFALTLAFGLVSSTAFAEEGASTDALTEEAGAVSGRISEDAVLDPIARLESARTFFLAETVEGAKAIPMTRAELSLEEGASDDLPVDSTVVGSFVQDGMTYAIEPGGESVALVAVDYGKLPEDVIRRQILAIPDTVSPDGIEAYSVTRIADGAFASLTKGSADGSYVGCKALLAEEELLAEAGIDADELARTLDPEQEMVDIDGDGKVDAVADPLEGCVGILALGIPASISSIEDGAFSGSDTLQYLVVSDDNPTYASFDGALYSADLATLRLIPEGRVGAVRIAPSATDVDPEVFSHCPSVDAVVADADSAAYELLAKDGSEYGNAIGEKITILFPAGAGDQNEGARIAELLDIVIGTNAMSLQGLSIADPSSDARATSAAIAPSSADAIRKLPAGFTVVDGRDLNRDAVIATASRVPLTVLIYRSKGVPYEYTNNSAFQPVGGSALDFTDYGKLLTEHYWGYVWTNSRCIPAPLAAYSNTYGFYSRENGWPKQASLNGKVCDTRNWRIAYKVGSAVIEGKTFTNTFIFFPPPYTVEVTYDGSYVDTAHGNAAISGSWTSEKEQAGTVVSKEAYDTGVDEPAAEGTLGIGDPENAYHYMPIPSSITEGYTFLGWNTDATATAETESGWAYRVGAEADVTYVTESLTLHAIYQKGYPVHWNTERFGGRGPSFAEFGTNSDGALGANTHTAALGEMGPATDTEVAIIEAPTDDSLPATSRFPRVENETEGARFLGWTDDPSGKAPSWREGERADRYFSWDDGTIKLDKGSFSVVDDAGDILETYDNAKFTNNTFYAVWETDVTFEAASYGGVFKGANADGTDSPSLVITAFNNRPIPTPTEDAAAHEDASDPASAHIPESSTASDAGARTIVPHVHGDAGYIADGWHFKGWTDGPNPNGEDGRDTSDASSLGCKDGTFSEADLSRALVPDGATTYYGVWECEVSWEADALVSDGGTRPLGADIVSKPSGIYLYGYDLASATVTGTPASHHFEGWRDTAGNAALLTDATTGEATYTVATAGPLTAYWAPNERAVVLNPNDTDDALVTEAMPRAYVVYGEQMSLYAAAPDASGPSDIMLLPPARAGYVFSGYWNTRYIETEGAKEKVPGTDGSTIEVEAKRYYGVGEDGSLASDATWDVTSDAVQLFAHWRYSIVFDANAQGASGDSASIMHKGASMPTNPDGESYQVDAYGNRYFYQDLEGADNDPTNDMHIVRIEALAGVPVKLPWAMDRKTAEGKPSGYDDTKAWSTSSAIDETHPVIAVDEEGFTLGRDDGSAHAAPSLVPGSDGEVTLYAIWDGKAHLFEVTLDAGGEAVAEDGSSWQDEVIENVVYDKTLRESGVSSVKVPSRDGHTFLGFFTEEEGGISYIGADGAPVVGRAWVQEASAGEDGKRHVTLHAQWLKDEYRISYDMSLPGEGNAALVDMTPGAQKVEGRPAAMERTWKVGDAPSHDGSALPTASGAPVATSSGLFFRNGYDFKGWYWTDEEGEAVMVSGADGSSRDRFSPSLSWQKEHKGALKADGTVESGHLTLYAAWSPKVYAVQMELGYREQGNRVLPDDTMIGMTAPNKVSCKGGVYYYEVAYEQDLTPFFDEDGTAIAPSDPPYAFVNWKAKGEAAGSTVLFEDDADASTPAILKGSFCPPYPLSARVAGGGGIPSVITFQGQWESPSPVSLHLSVGDATRGVFSAAAFDQMDPSIFDEAASTERELVFHDVGYERAFDLVSARSPYRPQPRSGYALAGFVLTNERGELLASDGTTLDHGAYDEQGELRGDLALLSSLSKLTHDTYALAVFSRNKMVVELDMSKIPAHEGYEGYELYTEGEDGTYESGWLIEGASHGSTIYSFNVTDAPFSLPDDVIVAGYVFCGWERANGDLSGAVPDMFDPSLIAADPNLAHQVFVPRFAEKRYEVSFLDGHKEGQGARSATVDFEGHILDAGDFNGEAGNELGSVLSMASVPTPDSALDDPDHAQGDAAGDHYHSYPFSVWRIGAPYASQVDPQERLADEKVSSSEWSAWFARFVKPVPGERSEMETLSIYAIWQRAISAVLPLSASVALDPNSGATSMPEKAYEVYATGLHDEEALEIASIRYESTLADGSSGDNVLQLDKGAPIRLLLFTNQDAPCQVMPTIDENGIIEGDFGASEGDVLSIDLSRSSATVGKSELASYGFVPFRSGGDALRMRFGLDLKGCSIHEVRALKDTLPSLKDAHDESGWSEQRVPFARLFYTVQVTA